MRLHVESTLDMDPATAWGFLESDAFRERLQARANVRVDLLSERTEGRVTIRQLRYVSGNELPSIAAKILGSKQLTYEQTNRLDLERSRLEWTVKLPVAGDRVSVRGVTTITATPTGCHRVVEGQITVAIPLVGGRIEAAVVAEFEKSMGRAVEIVRELAAEAAKRA